MSSANRIKVEKYDVHVYNSVLDKVHGAGFALPEFHVPGADITINTQTMFLGSRDEGVEKMNVEEVEIDISDNPTLFDDLRKNLEERERLLGDARGLVFKSEE